MAVAPVPVTPDVLAAHVRNFLTRSGFPVRDYTFSMADHPSGDPNFAQGWARPGQVAIASGARRGVQSLAARYGRRGPMSMEQLAAARLMLHEGLHQMRYGRGDGQQVNPYEEGATEAVTRDLLPIFTRRLFGAAIGPQVRDAVPNPYGPGTVNTRQLSVFGSGARKASDRKARVWRRTFLHADDAQRQQMVEAANAARAAWGSRTGR